MIPLPRTYEPELASNLRLLCSITGGQNAAQWEDISSSTPTSISNDCLVFTTTVSARFWAVHTIEQEYCKESVRFGSEIWRQLIRVPYMAKFVIFAKRLDLGEANLRVFCTTDDADEERTLELREHYKQVAKSRDVEILEGQRLYLEFSGNLVPGKHANTSGSAYHLSALGSRHQSRERQLLAQSHGEQLSIPFKAFEQNRLAFVIWLKDESQDPSGLVAFVREPLKWLHSLSRHQRDIMLHDRNSRIGRPICNLGLTLPQVCVNYDSVLGTPRRNSYHASVRFGSLNLAQIASLLDQDPPESYLLQQQQQLHEDESLERDSLVGSTRSEAQFSRSEVGIRQVPGGSLAHSSWLALAPKLGIPRDEVELIAEHWPSSGLNGHDPATSGSPALGLLLHWYRLTDGDLSQDEREQDLCHALIDIGRRDIAQRLDIELKPRKSNLSRSSQELLKEIEMIPMKSVENVYSNSELGLRQQEQQQAATKLKYKSKFGHEQRNETDKRRPLQPTNY